MAAMDPLSFATFLLATMIWGCLASSPYPSTNGSVYVNGTSYQFVPDIVDPSAVAFGTFESPANHISGFGVLRISSNGSFSAAQQYYALGYLESSLTWQMINDSYFNLISSSGGGNFTNPPPCLTAYIANQSTYISSQVSGNQGDPYWAEVGNVMSQYQGLKDGYAAIAPINNIGDYGFYLLNTIGDIADALFVACPQLRVNFDTMTRQQIEEYTLERSHCSSIVKLNGDFSDLLIAHNSWFQYQLLNRIMKHYNIQNSALVANFFSFSSYPGLLESLDDFWMLSSGLVVMETTNSIFNMSLYDESSALSLPSWVRVRVANGLSHDGYEWTNYVSLQNSGTYNNQYIVVDLNKFTPNAPLSDGLLMIAEQIPGRFATSDVTSYLERGYWPSYNIPWHADIYNVSGYPKMYAKYGDFYSYELAPRAEIFRRNQSSVVDIETLKTFIRYNDYTTDPYSQDNAYFSICSRGDLTPLFEPFGCIDAKVTNYTMASALQSEIINGPTTSNGIPPFAISQFANTSASFLGMPAIFNFSFEFQDPQWLNFLAPLSNAVPSPTS